METYKNALQEPPKATLDLTDQLSEQIINYLRDEPAALLQYACTVAVKTRFLNFVASTGSDATFKYFKVEHVIKYRSGIYLHRPEASYCVLLNV